MRRFCLCIQFYSYKFNFKTFYFIFQFNRWLFSYSYCYFNFQCLFRFVLSVFVFVLFAVFFSSSFWYKCKMFTIYLIKSIFGYNEIKSYIYIQFHNGFSLNWYKEKKIKLNWFEFEINQKKSIALRSTHNVNKISLFVWLKRVSHSMAVSFGSPLPKTNQTESNQTKQTN